MGLVRGNPVERKTTILLSRRILDTSNGAKQAQRVVGLGVCLRDDGVASTFKLHGATNKNEKFLPLVHTLASLSSRI